MDSVTTVPPMQIKLRALLSVYVVVPLCLSIVVADQLFWGARVKAFLPQTPNSLFLFVLLFATPHILASFFSFADKEYLVFYKKKLLFEVLPLMALSAFIVWYSFSLSFIVFVVYTEYHQIAQQIGMGRFYFKTRLPEYAWWRAIMVALATIGYGLAYQGSLFSEQFGKSVMVPFGLVLSVPFLLLSFSMYRRLVTREGRQYFGVLMASYVSVVLMLFVGYPIFTVFCTRFAHDVPAFMAYIMHDHNRQHSEGSNWLYRLLATTRLPIVILSPVLAVVLGYMIYRIPIFFASIGFLLGMLHYFVEGFIWKHGSIHRRYLHFV